MCLDIMKCVEKSKQVMSLKTLRLNQEVETSEEKLKRWTSTLVSTQAQH